MPPRQIFQQNTSDPAARPLAKAWEHHQAGRLAEAERLYRAAIALRPRHGDALRLLGTLFLQCGKPEQALPLLHDALQVQPKNPELLTHLGIALQNTGRGDDANTCFQQALAINPSYAEAHYHLANALREQGKFDAALEGYEMALRTRPNFAEAFSNMGVTLWNLERGAEAREKIERALQLAPDNVEIITDLGALLQSEGNVDEALKLFSRALARAPDHQRALWGKSLTQLALGEYREGWKLYETGLGRNDMRGNNPFAAVKHWNGQSAPNKHLLIWCEQGLGDSLQFIRYAEFCKKRVGKVSVTCEKPLLRLFKALPFLDDVFEPSRGGNFDEHVPMMSLPYIFDTVLEAVPAVVPYLRVDPEIQAKWAPKFAGVPGLKVGLVWAGSAYQGKDIVSLMGRQRSIQLSRADRQRSIAFERMKPWLGQQGAQFYNLQKDIPSDQIAALDHADRLTNFMGDVSDFADTAAIVQNLDLIITVDTSVAHLAGGLGKPVWILSRYNADWRWLQNRPTNPWYPTARIFGQPALGDWDSVLTEVGRELALEIAKPARAP